MLRAMQRISEAEQANQSELFYAEKSGDEIAFAQSLFSTGVQKISTGEKEKGLDYLEKAKAVFRTGNTVDHQQGLGWYWIIQADLANAGYTKLAGEI